MPKLSDRSRYELSKICRLYRGRALEAMNAHNYPYALTMYRAFKDMRDFLRSH